MSHKKFKPLGNRMLVKRSEPQVSKGGILLPDSAREKPKQGEILAVGPGKMSKDGAVKPMELKMGDRVLFGGFSGTEVEGDENAEFLILSEVNKLTLY